MKKAPNTKNNIKTHSGRFTTLSFRKGSTTENYCAKIVKITPHTITFRDVNSGEMITKKISSFVS